MSRSESGHQPPSNPFRDPDAKPAWAQLTRLGGDRVAILFEGLRKRLSGIAGLIEDLHFAGPQEGWAARYRQGETVLFTARVLPGSLEVALGMNASEREELLASGKSGAAVKRALAGCRNGGGEFRARFLLRNQSDVRSFASLLVWLSRRARKQ